MRLPFVLSPSSEIFCEQMDRVLAGIPGTFPCADELDTIKERNIERELLAVLFACEKPHICTFGQKVSVHMDHKLYSPYLRSQSAWARPGCRECCCACPSTTYMWFHVGRINGLDRHGLAGQHARSCRASATILVFETSWWCWMDLSWRETA